MFNSTNKKVFIFDLDGTLTESKSALQKDMADTLCILLKNGNKVVVISGGNFAQYTEQFLPNFDCQEKNFSNLYLLPTSGAMLYSWNTNERDWHKEYAMFLEKQEREKIFDAFSKIFKEVSFAIPKPLEGVQIEDRQTQVTFSALGQSAPLEEKQKWDPDHKKRLEMVGKLKKYIPEFEIRIGGTTSIDITKKGVDKQYGVTKFLEFVKEDKSESIFFGDALFEGGNDFSVTKTGMDTIQVSGPKDLLEKLRRYI